MNAAKDRYRTDLHTGLYDMTEANCLLQTLLLSF